MALVVNSLRRRRKQLGKDAVSEEILQTVTPLHRPSTMSPLQHKMSPFESYVTVPEGHACNCMSLLLVVGETVGDPTKDSFVLKKSVA